MTNVYRDPRVMVGNWSEDRAEPLEGVLVDYGYRSYNTTSGDAFPVPSKSPPKDASMTRAARMQRRGIRGTDSTFNMSQKGNVFEAMALSVNPGDGTGFTWRAPAPDRPVGQYSTTFGDTFGRFNGEPAVPDRPAGAKRKADRGRSATGMIGEVYVTHDEPGLDTRCQRVWLPNNDLIIDPADRGHVSSATARARLILVDGGGRAKYSLSRAAATALTPFGVFCGACEAVHLLVSYTPLAR